MNTCRSLFKELPIVFLCQTTSFPGKGELFRYCIKRWNDLNFLISTLLRVRKRDKLCSYIAF